MTYGPQQKEAPEVQRWSSRKFLSCMGWQAVFTVLLIIDKLPPETYLLLTGITLGGYLAGNVAHHWVTGK